MILLSSLTASVTLGVVSNDIVMTNTEGSYISWLGFFFFFRIAVATSSSCETVSSVASNC